MAKLAELKNIWITNFLQGATPAKITNLFRPNTSTI